MLAERTSLARLGALTALGWFATGCVSADAGYQDVRQLTAARLQSDVRWHRHEPGGAPAREVQQLLEQPLSAKSAAQVALLNSRALQADFEELGVARARLVEAWRLPNPSVGAALRFKGSDAATIDLDAMLDVSQLFFLPAASGPARAGMRAAQVKVAGRALDVAFQARVAFYEYQAAQQIVELRQHILTTLQAAFELSQRMYQAGNIPALAFANEQALYEEGRIAYATARTNLEAQRERLNAALGLWGASARWSAEPRLPQDISSDDSALSTLEARAIERSLELELARHRFEAAAKSANLSTARGWVPHLNAGVSAEREEGSWGVGPAVELEVPLFYQGQGQSAEAEAEARRQRELHGDLAVRIRARARALAVRVRTTEQTLQHYRQTLLPLRERIVQETQLQYNAMNASLFQLLQAKRDQIEAERAHVELLRDRWIQQAQVEQLLAGGRLPDGSAEALGETASGAVSADEADDH